MTQIQEMFSRTVSGMRTQPPDVRAPASAKPSNVGPMERAVSAAAGTLLLLGGLRRGPTVATVLGGGLLYRAISGSCPLYGALGVSTATGEAASDLIGQRSLPIGKSAEELYRLWTDPQALRLALEPLADVNLSGDGELHCSVRTSDGQPIEWDARVTEARPGELVRWESAPGAAMSSDGFIRFRPAPTDWGTEVTVGLNPSPHGGATAWGLHGLHPKVAAEKVLRRFKSLAETGEIPTLARQPAARNGGRDQYP
jgi:uncharacterized membrane protein